MKRLTDILLASLLFAVTAPALLAVALWIKCVSAGPAIYWSDRVGRGNSIFSMPKFRTMRTDTPQLPTRMLTDADNWMIPGGRFLRSTSLDELPQLWSIFKGEMSFIGPRPVLCNEDELLTRRTECDVHMIKPGLTGWAQVNGRDNLTVTEKVEFDRFYMDNQSLSLDARILAMTVVKVLGRDGYAQAGEESFSEAEEAPAILSLPQQSEDQTREDRRAA